MADTQRIASILYLTFSFLHSLITADKISSSVGWPSTGDESESLKKGRKGTGTKLYKSILTEIKGNLSSGYTFGSSFYANFRRQSMYWFIKMLCPNQEHILKFRTTGQTSQDLFTCKLQEFLNCPFQVCEMINYFIKTKMHTKSRRLYCQRLN